MEDIGSVSLTADQTKRLLATLPHASPLERSLLEEQLVTAYLPLAARIAGRYRQRGIDLDDLRQVANLALVTAVRRFDAERGDFSAFAAVTISGEVKKYFRDHGWMIRPPRSVQMLHAVIVHADELRSRTGDRPAGIADLAADLGVDRKAVVDATTATGCFVPHSLDAPLFADGPALGDTLIGETPDDDLVDEWVDFRSAWETLDDQERQLIALRFFEDLTQDSIAQIVGTSQMQVSRRLKGVLAKIRCAMAEPAAA
jgi:RNA polymerase sigma-B factor